MREGFEMNDLSGLELLELLQKKKRQLISEKKILEKKEANVYPIKDVPFEIPSNWAWCYLCDVSIIQEGPGIRKHQYSDDGIQFLTVTNILDGDVDLEKSKKYISLEQYKNYVHFTLNRGDIVTACSGGSWGKSAIYNLDEKIILNTSTLRLRFFNDLGDNRYLYYLTKTSYFKESLSIHTTGQQPNYGYFHYSKILIPLPPLHEQKRIVEILDEAFAAIDKAKAAVEKNLQNAKELFESYLNDVFTKASRNSKIVSLGEVCYTSGRIGWKGLTAKEYTKDGPLFLSVHSLNYGDYVDFRDAFHISQARYDESPEIMLQEGDVLICKDGAGIGKLGMVGKFTEQVTINSSLLLIRPNNNLSTKYLYYNLLSPSFQSIVKSRLQGATTPHLYQRDIVTFPILLPSKSDQEEIVFKLERLSEEVKKLQTNYQQKLLDFEELKKSILQKAFFGELTAKALTTVDED